MTKWELTKKVIGIALPYIALAVGTTGAVMSNRNADKIAEQKVVAAPAKLDCPVVHIPTTLKVQCEYGKLEGRLIYKKQGAQGNGP